MEYKTSEQQVKVAASAVDLNSQKTTTDEMSYNDVSCGYDSNRILAMQKSGESLNLQFFTIESVEAKAFFQTKAKSSRGKQIQRLSRHIGKIR